jgi:hypothetical protein
MRKHPHTAAEDLLEIIMRRYERTSTLITSNPVGSEYSAEPHRVPGRREARYDRPMTADVYPLQVLLVTLAGWVNRHQQHVIEYLVEENRVLKEQVEGRRLRFTDDQRRRLAAKARRLGRRVLRQVATIVTPDTILRWHRQLIARKWTFTPKRPGRPGIMKEISSLILRMATENPRWGYTRIQGALKNLGYGVARSTVAKVLKDNGIPPAPDRPSSWRTFLRPTGARSRAPTSSPARSGPLAG